jgi:hypothetical protein
VGRPDAFEATGGEPGRVEPSWARLLDDRYWPRPGVRSSPDVSEFSIKDHHVALFAEAGLVLRGDVIVGSSQRTQLSAPYLLYLYRYNTVLEAEVTSTQCIFLSLTDETECETKSEMGTLKLKPTWYLMLVRLPSNVP